MATGTARRRGIRLAATLTVVALALTGFQTSSSGGKGGSGKSRSKSSGSGGGCSSSKKKNDDYAYDDAGSGGGGSEYTAQPTVTAAPSPTSDFEVVVVDCVKPAQKKRKGKPARKADTTATLEITSRAAVEETVKVTLQFRARAAVVDTVDKVVTVQPGQTRIFDIAMAKPRTVDQVKACEVWRVGTP
ncbi:hypothetical protein ACFYV5_28435 [Streptomyces sp. NPDC003035]|uniref:hypothetical protein n=1 Tax=unclassified Streptomyces TaxID=2593676 RepID=UPI0033A5236F